MTNFSSLPPDLLIHIAQRHVRDERTRDRLLPTCEALKQAVIKARLQDVREDAKRPYRFSSEQLPTRTELMDRGCPKPKAENVLRTCGFIAKPSPQPGILETFYRASANFAAKEKGIVNNTPQGWGGKTYANGDRYEGQWENDERHGLGVYTAFNGTRYEGQFENDKMHGQGVYTWPDGSRYEGQFENEKMQGQGVHTWLGRRYEGQWKSDMPHGQGVMTSPDGSRYEGQFENGMLHGQGVYIFGSDSLFFGYRCECRTFNRGKIHGPSKMFHPDLPEPLDCEWKDDEPTTEKFVEIKRQFEMKQRQSS